MKVGNVKYDAPPRKMPLRDLNQDSMYVFPTPVARNNIETCYVLLTLGRAASALKPLPKEP
jgi:hypothetical protein